MEINVKGDDAVGDDVNEAELEVEINCYGDNKWIDDYDGYSDDDVDYDDFDGDNDKHYYEYDDGNHRTCDDDGIDGDDDGNDGGQELMTPKRADSSSWQNVWFWHTALRFLKI